MLYVAALVLEGANLLSISISVKLLSIEGSESSMALVYFENLNFCLLKSLRLADSKFVIEVFTFVCTSPALSVVKFGSQRIVVVGFT